ncbi:MAG: DUF368 domain-containing protein [Oscillospiraceae bacterium]|nr:DUF368 domain-containing protein [Oscillospiraceae bacterium]
MKYIILALKGVAVGIANAVPGVSGGTIAVVTKIYDELLRSLTPNIKRLIKKLPFLIPVGVGMLIGIFLASKVLGFLFETYNVPTQLFFVGVILGSIPMIYKECTKERRLSPVCAVPFLVGAAVMIAMFFIKPDDFSGITGEFNLLNGVIFFLSAVIAAAAMIVPGVSGALMLKVMGCYDAAVMAVNELNIPVLLIFAAGAVVGIFAAAGIISMLLKKFRRGTYCFISGLIIGSIPSIFPSEYSFNAQGIIGIILLAIGLAVPYLFELPFQRNKMLKKSDDE